MNEKTLWMLANVAEVLAFGLVTSLIWYTTMYVGFLTLVMCEAPLEYLSSISLTGFALGVATGHVVATRIGKWIDIRFPEME